MATTTRETTRRILEASGSRDRDVLYAAKTLYASTFARQRVVGITATVLGAAIAGAGPLVSAALVVAGIPLVLGGAWLWRRGLQNLAVVDETYDTYVSALPVPRASAPFGRPGTTSMPASAPAVSSVPLRSPSSERPSLSRRHS